MTKVFLFLFAGIISGFFLKNNKKILSFFDRAALISIFILLFLFGVEISTNKKIMDSFLNAGLSAIILAAGAVAGSIIFIIPVSFLIFKSGKKEK